MSRAGHNRVWGSQWQDCEALILKDERQEREWHPWEIWTERGKLWSDRKKENNKQNQGHTTLLRLTKNFMFLKLKTCNSSDQHPVYKLHWWELSSSTCSYSRRKTEQASNVSPNENSFSENQPQSRRKPWHNIQNCIKYLHSSICGPGARIRSAYIKEKMKW